MKSSNLQLLALRERKEPTIISGIQNEFTVCTTKFMPRKALINMAGNFKHKEIIHLTNI